MKNENYWANRIKIAQDKTLDRIYDEYVANIEKISIIAIILLLVCAFAEIINIVLKIKKYSDRNPSLYLILLFEYL